MDQARGRARPAQVAPAQVVLTRPARTPIVARVDVAPPYRYRDEVVEALLGHGLRASSTTPPQLLRDAINDLYRFEIRKLRERLLAGEILKVDYAGHVIALRRRYLLLSIPMAHWTR